MQARLTIAFRVNPLLILQGFMRSQTPQELLCEGNKKGPSQNFADNMPRVCEADIFPHRICLFSKRFLARICAGMRRRHLLCCRYEPGDQVFLCYGAHSNLDLLGER